MMPRIVLAEESATVRHMVSFSLHALNCQIVQVSRAQDVMAAVREQDTALILLRADATKTSAQQVQEQLRRDPSYRHIPLIILGDKQTSAAQWTSNDLTDYVKKPFLSQSLVGAVSRALGRPVPDSDLYLPYMADIPLARPSAKVEPSTGDATDPFLSDDPTSIIVETVEQLKTPAVVETPAVVDTTSEAVRSEVPIGKRLPQGLTAGEVEDAVEREEEILATRNDAEAEVEAAANTTPAEADVPYEGPLSEPVSEASLDPELATESEGKATLVLSSQALIPVRPVSKDDIGQNELTSDDAVPYEEPLLVTAPEGSPQAEILVDTSPNPALQTARDTIAVGQALSELTDPEALKALGVSRDVVERVAWAVVPALAEAILKEEIAKLVREHLSSTSE